MGPLQLKRLKPNDRIWALLIDTLWKENPGLYFEKYLSEADPEDPKQIWLKNKIAETIDFAQALGQDHELVGNRSAAIGQGGHTTSFMELLLGAYPTLAVDQDPELWIPTDRLMALGNGLSNEERSLVFEILKNGFFKFLQSIKIGAHPALAEGEVPENGTLQWTPEGGLEIWDVDHWDDFIGPAGANGADGITPHIGVNGNWFIGATDTGIAATGPAGANGQNGQNGADGVSPHVGVNGNWYIGAVDTGISATGPAGANGAVGDSGRGIVSVLLTNTVGLVKTYTITFTDETTTTFDVTDGADGTGGGGSGVIDEVFDVYIDFVDSVPFTYTCPVALRFTAMEYEGNAPSLSVALNTDMAQYADITITPDGPGLVILKGAIASFFSFDVYIDFAIAGAETYKCPYPLKFTAMEHEQANAPTLSIALNNITTKYQVQTVTADAPGLVTLKATIL